MYKKRSSFLYQMMNVRKAAGRLEK